MFDPIISSVISQTVETIQSTLQEAQQFTVKNVERCQGYLKAARAAVYGLEHEYDLILLQAKMCNTHNMEGMENLYKRIDVYLYEEKVRPLLRESISGLAECQKELKSNADFFLQWNLATV